MADSAPERLLKEIKANSENPAFWPELLQIYCTSKTRALKVASIQWVNSLDIESLSGIVCPVFSSAWENIGDLLQEQAKMARISRILEIKKIKEWGLDTGSIEKYTMSFLDRYLNNTLTDINAFEAAIRPVVSTMQLFSLKFTSESITRILESMQEYSLLYKDIATQLGLIVAANTQEIVGESIARLALILAHLVYGTLPQDQDFGKEIADLCQNLDNSVKHYAMQVLIVFINKQTLPEALIDQVFSMLCAFWDFPIQSIVSMCHRIFDALLPLLNIEKIENLCTYVSEIRSKHKFLVLKTISRAKGGSFVLQRFPQIVDECAKATLHMNTKPAGLELLQTLLKWYYSQSDTDWTELWKPILNEDYSLAEILPVIVKVDSGKKSFSIIFQSNLSEHNLVTAISLARKLDILAYTEEGISVANVEISIEKLKQMLGSVDLDLSARTLQILSETKRTTQSLNEVEKQLLLFFVQNCLKSSTQDFHHQLITHIGHILTRLRISKDPEKVVFARQLHEVCLSHIRRTAPFEVMFPALSILRQLYWLFGTAEGNENKGFFHKKIGSIQPLGEDFTVESVYVDLLIDCSYDKLRKLVYDILRVMQPARIPCDVQKMLELSGSPRTKDSDASAYLLRLNPDFSDIDFVTAEIRKRCENFSEPLPHGLIFQIRLTLVGLPFSVPLALKLIGIIQHISEKTCELLSRFDLSQDKLDCRGRGSDSEDHTIMGIWLACKENGFLLGAFSKWVVISSEIVEPLAEMANRIYQVLNSLKHRGAIEKTSGGFSALCGCLITHEETQIVPENILSTLFPIILSSENKNNILRRSAGIPYVFISTLKSPILVKKAMNFLVEHSQGTVATVQIHCLNIMRHLFTSSEIKNLLEVWLGPCLESSMRAFSSWEWSVRNSGMMAFSAIMHRILGQSKHKISMGVLKSRSPEIDAFLVKNLVLVEDPLPLLLLISKMEVDISQELFGSISSLLGHKHIMIRQKAARSLEGLKKGWVNSVTNSTLELTIGTFSLTVQRASLNLLHGALMLLGFLESIEQADLLANLVQWEEVIPRCGYAAQAFYKASSKFQVDIGTVQLDRTELHRVKPDIADSLSRIEHIRYQFSLNPSLDLVKEIIFSPSGKVVLDDPEIMEVVVSEITRNVQKFEKFDLGQIVVEMVDAVQNERNFGYAMSKLLKLSIKLEILLSRTHQYSILDNFKTNSRVRSAIVRSAVKWPRFPELALEFSKADEKDYVRRSWAESLQAYEPTMQSSPLLIRTLLVLLEDVNEGIRQTAAQTTSKLLELQTEQNPAICYEKLWKHIGDSLDQATLIEFLEPYLEAYLTFGGYLQSAENKNKIFYAEDENQFRDGFLEKSCISQIMGQYPEERDKFLNKAGELDQGKLEVEERENLLETLRIFSNSS